MIIMFSQLRGSPRSGQPRQSSSHLGKGRARAAGVHHVQVSKMTVLRGFVKTQHDYPLQDVPPAREHGFG